MWRVLNSALHFGTTVLSRWAGPFFRGGCEVILFHLLIVQLLFISPQIDQSTVVLTGGYLRHPKTGSVENEILTI